MTLTIQRRIVASFAIVLSLMVIMAAVAYDRFIRIERQAALIAANFFPGLSYINQLVADRSGNYSLTQQFEHETDVAAKQKIIAGIRASRAHLNAIEADYARTISVPAERQLFDAYEAAVILFRTAQDDLLQAGIEPKATRDVDVRRSSAELYPKFAQVQSAATLLVDFNKAALIESTEWIGASAAGAKTGVIASLGVALAVAFLCGFLLLRSITRPLDRLVTILDVMRTGDLSSRLRVDRGDEFGILATGFNRMSDELAALVGRVQESGLQVNASVLQIAATAKQQQATANEIATTTTEIGATSREIASTCRKLVGAMTDVAAVAEQSAVLAGQGQTGLTHMEETMQHVMDAARWINAKLAVLSDKASNISQVVTTITRVADQTNLLSLNAAIEAEKAGEYGRGFAVVATEIRRLADQTAVATYDIEQMVKEIQSAVVAGVMGMDKFSEEVRRGMEEVQQVGGQLTQVILQVQAMSPRLESVNDGMQAQASGAEQITEALTQLGEAARQTVDSLRQSGQAIDELNGVAIGLRGGVSRFTLQAA
jgi:methyl-accepting chemotaxis protein WspA